MGIERYHFPVILRFMDGGIPAGKCRMRLIDTAWLASFTNAAFAGSVAVEEDPAPLSRLMRARSQTLRRATGRKQTPRPR